MAGNLQPEQVPITHRRVVLVDPTEVDPVVEPHGLRIDPVISRPHVETKGISGGLVWVPPGGAARAHQHRGTDVIVVVTHGAALTLWGDELENEIRQGVGQFLHIPAPVPHAVVNLSLENPVLALEFRADPEFSRDMVLLPHLQSKVQGSANAIAAGSSGIPNRSA
jgi:uncharacterized RmlC-like cupin family protein